MRLKRLWQVDAFADRIYRGNPCAVVFDAADLTKDEMQTIAAEMNLAETVFLLPPTVAGADYRVRIFTPRSELPFAGHPTISAAFSVYESLKAAGFGPLPDVLRQECGVGIIPVAVVQNGTGTEFVMTQAKPEFRALSFEREQVATALGCSADDLLDPPAEAASTGIWWMFARLGSAAAVAGARPDMAAISALCREIGITGLGAYSIGATASDCDVKLRCFAPDEGVPEDPVTGSANGCLAALLARNGTLGPAPFSYRAEQGTELGRDGRVSVTVDAAGTGPKIGGRVVRVMTAELEV